MSVGRFAMLLAALAPAACSSPPPDAGQDARDAAPVARDQALPGPADNAARPVEKVGVEADYLGKWIGPEGLVLEVKSKAGGGVTIVNQWTLDDKGTFEGSVTAEGLRFMRNGEAVTASPGDGAATGMKWLAGKTDCLIVTPGSEGYCRD